MELILSSFIPCQGCLSFPCIRWAKTLTWHWWTMELTWWFPFLLVPGYVIMVSLLNGLYVISPDSLKNFLESATAMWCEVTAHRQSSFGQQKKYIAPAVTVIGKIKHVTAAIFQPWLVCHLHIVRNQLSFGVYLPTLDDGVKRIVVLMFLHAQPSVYSISERDCQRNLPRVQPSNTLTNNCTPTNWRTLFLKKMKCLSN